MKTKKLQLYQTMVDMELEAVSLLIECSIHTCTKIEKDMWKKRKNYASLKQGPTDQPTDLQTPLGVKCRATSAAKN